MKKFFMFTVAVFLLLSCAKEQKDNVPNEGSEFLTTQRQKVITVQTKAKSQNKINDPKFNPELLYGIWTVDNRGPHADFKLNKETLYIVDSDDDGNHEYSISHDSLIVKYKDYKSIGII
jgi:hypothetical protein